MSIFTYSNVCGPKLGCKIVESLDNRNIMFSSVDLVRFTWLIKHDDQSEGEDGRDDKDEKGTQDKAAFVDNASVSSQSDGMAEEDRALAEMGYKPSFKREFSNLATVSSPPRHSNKHTAALYHCGQSD